MSLLRSGPRTSGEIASRFNSSWPTISRHLAVLRDADLVLAERKGQEIYYELNTSVFQDLVQHLIDVDQTRRARYLERRSGVSPRRPDMAARPVRHLVVIAYGLVLSTLGSLGLFGPYLTWEGQSRLDQLIVLFLLPITASVIYSLIGSLQRRKLPQQENGSADRAIQGIVFWVVLFLMGVHTLMLAVLFSVEWVQPWAKRGVVMLLGVTLVGIGNLLPRTRPNMALGIRTARTLSDRQLWMLTHRMSGYATVAVGVVTLFASVSLQGDQVAAVPAIAFAIAGILLLAGYWKFSRVARQPAHCFQIGQLRGTLTT